MSVRSISGEANQLIATPYASAPQSRPSRTADVAPQAAPTTTLQTQDTVDLAQNASHLDSAEANHSLLKDAVKRANETVQALRSNLQFTVDETTGIDVVKFIDIKTKEVIRQIPSEEMLALARRLDELKGLLIKDKA